MDEVGHGMRNVNMYRVLWEFANIRIFHIYICK